MAQAGLDAPLGVSEADVFQPALAPLGRYVRKVAAVAVASTGAVERAAKGSSAISLAKRS